LLAQNPQIFAKPKPGLSPPPHGSVNYAYAKIENDAANKISLETINPYLGFRFLSVASTNLIYISVSPDMLQE
jgi:hypothetical protein